MDILILAGIALVLILKLGSLLGRRTQEDEKRTQALQRYARQQGFGGSCVGGSCEPRPSSNVIDIFDVMRDGEGRPSEKSRNSEISPSVSERRIGELSEEELKDFLAESENIVEDVSEAFSAGNLEILKKYLSPDIYDKFRAKIEKFEELKEKISTNIIAFSEKKTKSLKIDGMTLRIEVQFDMDQINFIENEQGEVVRGSKQKTDHVSEVWTFEKSAMERDRNWLVVAMANANG